MVTWRHIIDRNKQIYLCNVHLYVLQKLGQNYVETIDITVDVTCNNDHMAAVSLLANSKLVLIGTYDKRGL